MKRTAHALFRIAMFHILVTGVMLITEVVTLIIWAVTFLRRSYIRRNGRSVPGQNAVGASWIRGSLDVRSVDIHLMTSLFHT